MTIQTMPAISATDRSAGLAAVKQSTAHHAALPADIIDIRRETGEMNILDELRRGLRPDHGAEKTLPTLLLYDEQGLKLFERLTYLDEYYLTNAEIEVLEKYADRIAERVQPNSLVVELGSGNLRKVNILLQALERAGKNVQYYALDLNLDELKRTLAQVPHGTYRHVKCAGLHGTYDDGLEWLKSAELQGTPKTILWLGSSLGNFKRHEAGPFLRAVANSLRAGDTMLVGIDACNDPKKIFHAYNDKDGWTHKFILNGLEHANRLDPSVHFDVEDWDVVGEYMYDIHGGRHHAFVVPKRDVFVDGVRITQGERVRIEESYKYSAAETKRLWEATGFVESTQWANRTGDYALHLVSKPKVAFPLKASEYARNAIPTLEDWSRLWTAWDAVTLEMIPKEELLAKPIKLRNACIFYLGHIPTFLDIHLTRATNGKPTEPAAYQQIFERGIDPDVDDPTKCHNHSEVPEEWPPLEEILTFQQAVRQGVKSCYADGTPTVHDKIGRALWIGFEHEMMHLETLLYMLVQSEKTVPPPGVAIPDFEAMAPPNLAVKPENRWFKIPEADIDIGMDDVRGAPSANGYFGWDNEIPSRKTHVKPFEAQARPITNGEYAEYLTATGSVKFPSSWCEPESRRDSKSENGEHQTTEVSNGNIVSNKFVRTVFGKVPLKYVLDWPVMASYDELKSFADWSGGRIPTMEEVRRIYDYARVINIKEVEKALAKTIPAVNGHLLNDGVEETPPQRGCSNGSSGTGPVPNLHELFSDLEEANVGFKHWHPVPVVQRGDRLCGQGEQGGVWEWTSTVLEKHPGFEPMTDYPGYTADFFDGKHNVVLGGSWATHPILAGRKTFVNWYQRNYPFVWAGARLVRDI